MHCNVSFLIRGKIIEAVIQICIRHIVNGFNNNNEKQHMKLIDTIQLIYKTPEHLCGYLPEKQAITCFFPLKTISSKHFSQLCEQGYRRSGAYMYRPQCTYCAACIPIRINAFEFFPSRSQKRCWNKNQDLMVIKKVAQFTEEHYWLYEQYITARHVGGDMFPPSKQQFIDFLCSGTSWCHFYELRRSDNTLVAVTVADTLMSGLSPLYTFFAITEDKRSLGTFCILWLIHQAKQQKLPFVYLGYWIKQCYKMSYKHHFKPYELLINETWIIPSVHSKQTS